MRGEVQDSKGDVSSMRVALRWARRLGAFMILNAIAMSWYLIVKNDGSVFSNIVLTLIAIGGGLITGVSAAKSWQSQAESRIENAPSGGGEGR